MEAQQVTELLRILQLELERLKFHSDIFKKDLAELKASHTAYIERDTLGQASLDDRVKGINSQVGSLYKTQEVLEARLLKIQDSLDSIQQWKTQREAQILIFASLPVLLGGMAYMIKLLVMHSPK